MKKSLTRFSGLAAAVALAGSVLSAAPAQALPGDAIVTAPPVTVLNDGCVDHPINYSVEVPAGTTSWTLDLDMMGPDGARHGGQLIGTYRGDAVTGTEGLQLCSLFEPLGTYTIMGSVEYKVGTAPTVFGESKPLATFEAVGTATSTVKLKAKRKKGKIQAQAKVTVKRGTHVGPVDAGGKVIFQKKAGKKWKKVAKGKTNAQGLVKVKFKSKGKTTLRAKFKGMGEVLVGVNLPIPAATSKNKTVR